jgi:hypothetical protein
VVWIVLKHFCKLYETNRNQKKKKEKEIKKNRKDARGTKPALPEIRPRPNTASPRRGMPPSSSTR